MTSASPLRIVPATAADVPLVFRFVRKLAEYEKLSHEVTATEAGLREGLFGPRAVAEVLLAYWADEPASFALYFHNFSTFLGKPGIYLEDLFVEPTHRGRGIGKALLIRVAQIACERNCGRLQWAVLDWNRPAIDFYQSLGAVALDAWTIMRVSGDRLHRLAELDQSPANTP
jgi:GNAT superfamily N-acetyltransferase